MIDYSLTLSDLADAKEQPHEGAPVGVPAGWGWHSKALPEAWNTVPDGFKALQGWGQVFGADAVEIRGMQTWALTASGWRKVQASAWDGAAFRPDYAGNESVQAIRRGDGVEIPEGRAFHWWHAKKARMPRGLQAVLVLFQARGTPGALIGAGCDYWRDVGSVWAGLDVNNKGAGVGRLRHLTDQWRAYGFTTATKDQLASF